ncbi:hypothetical protein QJS66_01480 [Kocuria rhizophila]|nr:hypothetical protein QJS66_01480 [Kocuria rhizophila]
MGRERPDLAPLNDDDLAYAKTPPGRVLPGHRHDPPRGLRGVPCPARSCGPRRGLRARRALARRATTWTWCRPTWATRPTPRPCRCSCASWTPPWTATSPREHADEVRATGCGHPVDLTAAAAAGSDHQWQFFRAFLRRACTEAQVDRVAGFSRRGVPEGVELDTDTRWAVLTALVAAGRAGTDEIEAALREDNTETRAIAAATARAAAPTPEAGRDVASGRGAGCPAQLPAAGRDRRLLPWCTTTPCSPRTPPATSRRSRACGVQRTHELAQQIAVGPSPAAPRRRPWTPPRSSWTSWHPAHSGRAGSCWNVRTPPAGGVRAQQVDAARAQHPADGPDSEQ